MSYYIFCNRYIWAIDRILTDTTTLSQSEPGSNGNKEVLYILQSSRIEVSPPDAV